MYENRNRFVLELSRLVKPATRMRVRTARLLVKVVSKRNYEQRNGGDDGDAYARRGRWENGWVLCKNYNNRFWCSSRKAAAEVACSSARKINMLKEVVAHRLRRTVSRRRGDDDDETTTVVVVVPDNGKSWQTSSVKKTLLGIKGETTENLGRSLNCLLSRFSGMFRLKKKRRSGFRLRKWKITRKSCAVKKSFARIPRKMMMRKVEEEEEEIEEEELCKKRILMGEKCKPLNVSGSLHYDQNGVLLPEPLLLPPACQSSN